MYPAIDMFHMELTLDLASGNFSLWSTVAPVCSRPYTQHPRKVGDDFVESSYSHASALFMLVMHRMQAPMWHAPHHKALSITLDELMTKGGVRNGKRY